MWLNLRTSSLRIQYKTRTKIFFNFSFSQRSAIKLISVLKGWIIRHCEQALSKSYRVSHETWPLVNGFECLLPYIILDIKDFSIYFTQVILLWTQFSIKWLPCYISYYTFLYQLELNKLWKKTFKTIHKLSCFVDFCVITLHA